MKVTIELDQEDILEAVELIASIQVDVQIMIQKLEDLQSVIESYQAEGPDGFATFDQDEGC